MNFPHKTLKEFALTLAKEGNLKELESLLKIYPKTDWLKEFIQAQYEMTKVLHEKTSNTSNK